MKSLAFLRRYQQTTQFIRVAQRGLYFKDKDLDKANYKPSDKDQLEAYIKNYMQDDPKAMSEEDKLRLFEEFKTMKAANANQQALDKAAAKSVETTPKEQTKSFNINQQQSENGDTATSTTPVPPPVIDPTVLKDMFDKMVEIDSDPDSKRAQDYYKKLEEIERTNPNKKKSQIIIKTMRRGRTVSKETFSDPSFIGKKLTEDERMFHKKFIDTKAVTFPEINPIEMKVKGQGKELKLATFRYPSQKQERKGIIYYNNGYGDYCARYAFFAEYFAKAGYDFVCMDHRGFGHSDGKRSFIESEEIMFEDLSKFHDLVDEKFGGKDVPKLQIGTSLGGLASVKMSIARPNFYNGMGLLVPYMKLLNQHLIDQKMGIIKFIDKFAPSFRVPLPLDQKKALLKNKFLENINNDPMIDFSRIPVRNLVVNEGTLRRFRQKDAEECKTPFLMILGGRDQIVDNRGAKEFFEIQSAQITDKDLITYDDADHFIMLDNEFSSLVAKDLIGWFNTHV